MSTDQPSGQQRDQPLDLLSDRSVARSRLEPGIRPPLTRWERVVGLIGFHLIVYRRTWRGRILGRLVLPVLVLSCLGVGVGSLVDHASGGVDGVPYLRYVVPGLVMSTAMQWAFGESTYPIMTYLRWNQMYAVMLAAPHRVGDVITAHWLAIMANIGWSSAAFLGIAAVFGGVGSWWALLGVPIAVLTAMAFVAPLFAYAGRAETEEGFTSLFRLVVTPLMLFSGTFYPIEQLPAWLQGLAWVTPLWHGTELARASFLGTPGTLGALTWAIHLGVLTAYVGVGYLLTKVSFAKRLAT